MSAHICCIAWAGSQLRPAHWGAGWHGCTSYVAPATLSTPACFPDLRRAQGPNVPCWPHQYAHHHPDCSPAPAMSALQPHHHPVRPIGHLRSGQRVRDRPQRWRPIRQVQLHSVLQWAVRGAAAVWRPTPPPAGSRPVRRHRQHRVLPEQPGVHHALHVSGVCKLWRVRAVVLQGEGSDFAGAVAREQGARLLHGCPHCLHA